MRGKKKNSFNGKSLDKFFNKKNVIIVLLFLAATFIWRDAVTGIVLVSLFAPMTYTTVRYAKMVPHVSIESNTSMSCFMGFVFGPVIGCIYGLCVGGYAYVMNSFISPTYLATIFLAGLSAAITGISHNVFGFDFSKAFFIAIIARTVVAWPLFGLLGVDPVERVTHQVSQFFSNLLLYLPLLSAFYGIVSAFL